MSRLIAVLILLFGASGCATGPTLSEPNDDEPYATLLFERSEGKFERAFGGLKVIPEEINGLPPDGRRKWDFHRLRVAPGELVVFVRVPMENGLVGWGFLEFPATAGDTVSFTTESEDVVVAHDAGGREVARLVVAQQTVPTEVRFEVVSQ